MTFDALFERLRAEGLVHSGMPALPAPPRDPSPWFMRAMLGVAGWLAGLVFALFLGGMFSVLLRHGGATIALGVGLCALAGACFRLRDSAVLSQMALALSMAGQALFTFGLLEVASRHTGFVAVSIALFEAALVVAMRSFLHRIMSTLFAAGALFYALDQEHATALGTAALAGAFVAVWVAEARWRVTRAANAMAAFGLGLGLALTLWGLPAVLDPGSRTTADAILDAAAGGGALAIYALIATRAAPVPTRLAAVAATAALAAAADAAPGIVACALAAFVSFGAGQRALAAWAATALAGYLAVFYYGLPEPLGVKSASLALCGMVLVAARVFLAWRRRSR